MAASAGGEARGTNALGGRPRLRIVSGRAGWGAFAVVKLAIAMTFAIPWWTQWGGISVHRPGHSLLASLALLFVAWVFCAVVEVTHGVFTLELSPSGARLELRTPFRRRRWMCRLDQFGLGVVDEVRAARQSANGDWLSERYIRLFFDEQEVRFMLGHDEQALSRTRFQVARWLSEASAALEGVPPSSAATGDGEESGLGRV